MLIIGERVNTSREEINDAVERRDDAFIRAEVKAQLEAGAHVIDVNAGSRSTSELPDLIWLVNVIQEAVAVRLSIDSADPRCLFEVVEKVNDIPVLNSTTAEKGRLERMAPVIRKRECDVVGLCMDEQGIPKTLDKVMRNAQVLIKALEALGVPRNRIYLDPMLQALSVDKDAGITALRAISRITREFEGVNTLCGLSNISFGLPKRSLINLAFLILARDAGLSAAILDPLDGALMSGLRAAEAVLGRDDYCFRYLKAYREGRLKT